RGLLDLAESLEPVLADLEGHVRAVAHLALRDELGRPAHDRQPILPRRPAPGGCGAAGGGDGRLDVRPIALGERSDAQLAIDRRMGLEGAGGAVNPPAVDEVLVVSAEPGSGLLDAR